jgi:hypothetical protein
MTCPECGAPAQRGLSCRQQWDELLALEFSDPRAGKVHFLTVASYELQHPQAFQLDPEARAQILQALEDVVVHDRPVPHVREEMQRRFAGTVNVLTDEPEPSAADRTWSLTVADVGDPDAHAHAARVRAWARAVYADLGGG